MPLSRQTPYSEVLRKLRALGFEGPLPGGKHPLMRKGKHKIHIPNPHAGDIHVNLLRRLLRQWGIFEEEWEQA